MKKPAIFPTDAGHQTVTEFIQIPTPHEAIQIGFTDQKVGGHAGPGHLAGRPGGRDGIPANYENHDLATPPLVNLRDDGLVTQL